MCLVYSASISRRKLPFQVERAVAHGRTLRPLSPSHTNPEGDDVSMHATNSELRSEAQRLETTRLDIEIPSSYAMGISTVCG